MRFPDLLVQVQKLADEINLIKHELEVVLPEARFYWRRDPAIAIDLMEEDTDGIRAKALNDQPPLPGL